MRQKFLFSSAHETGNLLQQRASPFSSSFGSVEYGCETRYTLASNGRLRYLVTMSYFCSKDTMSRQLTLTTARSVSARVTIITLARSELPSLVRSCFLQLFYFLRFLHSQKGSLGPPQLASYIRRPFLARRHL